MPYGIEVTSGTEIEYICNKNYDIHGTDFNVCNDGEWTRKQPTCNHYCHSGEINTLSTEAKNCTLNNKITSCSKRSSPGTSAFVNCREFYEGASSSQMVTCDENGQWQPKPIRCKPICGVPLSSDLHKIGTNSTNYTYLQWSASIYDKCATEFERPVPWYDGTIISAQIVVASLLYFWDANTKQINSVSNYEVLVGKNVEEVLKKKQNMSESLNKTEKNFIYNIKDIKHTIHNQVDKNINTAIALIVLEKPIVFDKYIAPICLSLDDNNTAGLVVTWKSSEAKDVRNERYVRKLNKRDCSELTAMDKTFQLSPDVFCASTQQEPNDDENCLKSNGAGWYIEKKDGKLYLAGVSTGLSQHSKCHDLQTFVNTKLYQDFFVLNVNETDGYSIIKEGIKYMLHGLFFDFTIVIYFCVQSFQAFVQYQKYPKMVEFDKIMHHIKVSILVILSYLAT